MIIAVKIFLLKVVSLKMHLSTKSNIMGAGPYQLHGPPSPRERGSRSPGSPRMRHPSHHDATAPLGRSLPAPPCSTTSSWAASSQAAPGLGTVHGAAAPSRLPPFDPCQPSSWRAFFRRVAKRFGSPFVSALPVHDYNGDLVGD